MIRAALDALVAKLDQAHMFACDLASNSHEVDKFAVIGQAIREARAALATREETPAERENETTKKI